MKMLDIKLVTILGILLIGINMYAQTPIDVVRASNYYSKAVYDFNNSYYSPAYDNLIEAEKNLKGKTNIDLEFLRIVLLYDLKKFDEAYKYIKLYYENPPWKPQDQKNQGFKNVDLLSDTYKYDEFLTAIFIDLENKNNLQQNVDPVNIAQEVAKHTIKYIENNVVNLNTGCRFPYLSDGYYKNQEVIESDGDEFNVTNRYSNKIIKQPYVSIALLQWLNNKLVMNVQFTYNGQYSFSRRGKYWGDEDKDYDPHSAYYDVTIPITIALSGNGVTFSPGNVVAPVKSQIRYKYVGYETLGPPEKLTIKAELNSMNSKFLTSYKTVNGYLDSKSVSFDLAEELAYKKDPSKFTAEFNNIIKSYFIKAKSY